MSLDNPSKFERTVSWFSGLSLAVKAVVILLPILLVLGAALWFSDMWTGYFADRKADKLKANINAAVDTALSIEKGVANLEIKQEGQLVAANIAVQEFLDEVGASEEQRIESNRALANVEAAKNTPMANVTAQELKEILGRLDK
jgi:hypothetical protein